jgi:hypothetical protein
VGEERLGRVREVDEGAEIFWLRHRVLFDLRFPYVYEWNTRSSPQLSVDAGASCGKYFGGVVTPKLIDTGSGAVPSQPLLEHGSSPSISIEKQSDMFRYGHIYFTSVESRDPECAHYLGSSAGDMCVSDQLCIDHSRARCQII